MVGVAWVLELSAMMMTLCQRLATDFFFFLQLFCFALLCTKVDYGAKYPLFFLTPCVFLLEHFCLALR